MNDTDKNSEYEASVYPGVQEPNEQGINDNTAPPVVLDLMGNIQEVENNHVGTGSRKV